MTSRKASMCIGQIMDYDKDDKIDLLDELVIVERVCSGKKLILISSGMKISIRDGIC